MNKFIGELIAWVIFLAPIYILCHFIGKYW